MKCFRKGIENKKDCLNLKNRKINGQNGKTFYEENGGKVYSSMKRILGTYISL